MTASMKTVKGLFSVVALSVLLGAPTLAGEKKVHGLRTSCSNATLKGTYLYQANGIVDGNPYSEAGREIFDGAGGVVVSYVGTNGPVDDKGRYSVNPDCSGKITYSTGEGNAIFVSPDGDRVVYVVTGGSGKGVNALSGVEIRVAP